MSSKSIHSNHDGSLLGFELTVLPLWKDAAAWRISTNGPSVGQRVAKPPFSFPLPLAGRHGSHVATWFLSTVVRPADKPTIERPVQMIFRLPRRLPCLFHTTLEDVLDCNPDTIHAEI